MSKAVSKKVKVSEYHSEIGDRSTDEEILKEYGDQHIEYALTADKERLEIHQFDCDMSSQEIKEELYKAMQPIITKFLESKHESIKKYDDDEKEPSIRIDIIKINREKVLMNVVGERHFARVVFMLFSILNHLKQ